MSEQEQHDYPEMWLHYKIAVATGLSHHEALIYSQAQLREKHDLSHFKINS